MLVQLRFRCNTQLLRSTFWVKMSIPVLNSASTFWCLLSKSSLGITVKNTVHLNLSSMQLPCPMNTINSAEPWQSWYQRILLLSMGVKNWIGNCDQNKTTSKACLVLPEDRRFVTLHGQRANISEVYSLK